MFLRLLFWCLTTFILSVHGQTKKGIQIGFPENWDGDWFRRYYCPSKNIPEWLNGYFLVQSCGSYGKLSEPLGKKNIHMFDGFGAVASFEMYKGNVGFSAQYYPSRMYKIWEFYDRDLSKSTIAWTIGKSPYNVSSVEMWNHIVDDKSFPVHPNVDFWKIGNTVLGATEFIGVGMQFNVSTLSNFTAYPFKDSDDFFNYRSTMRPLDMPVHERMEPDGSLYAAVAAYDPTKNKMYQVIFRVTPDGTRTLEGTFDHGTYDPSKCMSDGTYTGDKKVLAGYMHSIASTKRYIILPVTSMIYNPCKMQPLVKNVKSNDTLPAGVKSNINKQEFAPDVPVRFVIFDKVQKRFITEQPIMTKTACFITHQFNAYEDDDGTLVADMIGSENLSKNGYDVLYVENMLNEAAGPIEVKMYRYRINPNTKTVQTSNILADKEVISAEFSNYNRDYMQMKYKYGYIVEYPYMAGSKIAKIDMDARKIVAEFGAPNSRGKDAVFREPWFVPKPGSKDEDDGVILALAGDISSSTTSLYVLDGKSLQLIGESEIPTFIPFGFHNRFYSFKDLGEMKIRK